MKGDAYSIIFDITQTTHCATAKSSKDTIKYCNASTRCSLGISHFRPQDAYRAARACHAFALPLVHSRLFSSPLSLSSLTSPFARPSLGLDSSGVLEGIRIDIESLGFFCAFSLFFRFRLVRSPFFAFPIRLRLRLPLEFRRTVPHPRRHCARRCAPRDNSVKFQPFGHRLLSHTTPRGLSPA